MRLRRQTRGVRCRTFLSVVLLVHVVACNVSGDGAGRDRALRALQGAVMTGTLGDRKLVESSGLTVSSADANLRAGVLWSNNDSGNDETLFAMDSAGRALARWRVTGATNADWEAISTGACADGPCLYIADVGDNSARRRKVTIWRVPEPIVVSDPDRSNDKSPKPSDTAPAERLDFVYPDGAHDVEAIWVSPDTSVWLVTKRPHTAPGGRFRNVLLFRLPAAAWSSTSPVTAELVDSLPLTPIRETTDGWVTDAAFVPGRVALRTYGHVVLFDADSATGRPGALLARCTTAALRDRRGEAIAWLPGGRLMLTSEGKGSRVWAGACAPG
ncbi:MAG: hypothetical protein V4617_18235 [Gemmatimonadota bacterium]